MGNILFYYPRPLAESPQVGSQVRPLEMLKAFCAIGFSVDEITGTIGERAEKIRSLTSSSMSERQYSFLYAEADSTPPLVRDKTFSIKNAVTDLSLFTRASKAGVPVGLFYRDIYWRSSVYQHSVNWYKRLIMTPLYLSELAFYSRTINILFVPSLNMLQAFPKYWHFARTAELPPGCKITFYERPSDSGPQHGLHLLYVGGITPPLYDIQPLLNCVNSIPGIGLTICCRQSEWDELSERYGPSVGSQVRIIHAKGADLADLYYKSDVSMVYFPPHTYRDFAMPVKLFEAMGYGVPIISSEMSAVGTVVKTEGIGWTVRSDAELRQLLIYLRDNPTEVKAVGEHVCQARFRHTWEERARQVAQFLNAIPKERAL